MKDTDSAIYKICDKIFDVNSHELCSAWLAGMIAHCNKHVSSGWIDRRWFRPRSVGVAAQSVIFIEQPEEDAAMYGQLENMNPNDCISVYHQASQDYLNNISSHIDDRYYLMRLSILNVLLLLAVLIVVAMKMVIPIRSKSTSNWRPKVAATEVNNHIHIEEKAVLQLQRSRAIVREAYYKISADAFINSKRLLLPNGSAVLPILLPDKRALAHCLSPNVVTPVRRRQRFEQEHSSAFCYDELLKFLDKYFRDRVHIILVVCDDFEYDGEHYSALSSFIKTEDTLCSAQSSKLSMHDSVASNNSMRIKPVQKESKNEAMKKAVQSPLARRDISARTISYRLKEPEQFVNPYLTFKPS